MEEYKKKYFDWCSNPFFDENTRRELKNLTDENEIKDRFYQDLSFGTGGLRGIIGAGSNRINLYTVTKVTQGLANYLKKGGQENKGVAIAFDCRNFSKEFAKEAALCLNANGIKAYLFSDLRPTPELSFAVRRLKCKAGIVITASHNPAEYNGYKVYGEDGAQVTYPIDEEIIKEVKKVSDFSEVKRMKEDEALKLGLLNIIGEEIDKLYLEELKKLILSPLALKKVSKDLKIVYTPLHGTGAILVPQILRELGFERLYVVKEQEKPDGNFPTVKYPNPEDKDAFYLALKLAREVRADLVLATDPDADRLGIYVNIPNTEKYIAFSGNMTGLLILEYQLQKKRELGLLPSNPKNGAIIKTIVSSKMTSKIAQKYGVSLFEVLTGFKFIGERIKIFEQNIKANQGNLSFEKGAYEYLFGYEESQGYLVGTHARDKDAVGASMILGEAMAYYYEKGISLWEQMLHMFEEYGYYQEDLFSLTLKGVEGAYKINLIMENFQKKPPFRIGRYRVIKAFDYLKGEALDLESKNISSINLPKSKVLYYELEKDAWICLRPSGTEPKIKFYLGVRGDSFNEAKENLEDLGLALKELIK